MNDGSFTFTVGFLFGMFIFTITDPDVYDYEIEHATQICQARRGILRIETSVDEFVVTGVCKDGLKFNQRIQKEQK